MLTKRSAASGYENVLMQIKLRVCAERPEVRESRTRNRRKPEVADQKERGLWGREWEAAITNPKASRSLEGSPLYEPYKQHNMASNYKGMGFSIKYPWRNLRKRKHFSAKKTCFNRNIMFSYTVQSDIS